MFLFSLSNATVSSLCFGDWTTAYLLCYEHFLPQICARATLLSDYCVLLILFSFPPDKLMKEIGLKDDAAIVDLTRSRVTVESLTEAKVMCNSEDKVSII